MTTGVKVDESRFENVERKEDGNEDTSEGLEGGTENETMIRIQPITILKVILAIAVAVLLFILLKRFYDNFYIIRHNLSVKRNKKDPRYKTIKRPRNRRHRRK